MKVDAIRRNYNRGRLSREGLSASPIVQFEQWLQEAIAADLPDPTAMCVATVSPEGQPSQRLVLLKDFNKQGFVFYTNLESRKAQELQVNPKVSLHFPWHALERQVIVYGQAQPVPTPEVLKYFLSRPKESQLAAWASAQSRAISSREALLSKFNEIKQRFSDGDISLPHFWGGFRVVPHQIEFWQGGEHRLHDRFMYTLQADLSWDITRLNP